MLKQKAFSPEGLPEIAETRYKKPVLLVILGGLLLLLITHFYSNARKNIPKTEFSVEESYTIPSEKQALAKTYPATKETNPAEVTQLSEQQLVLLQAKQKELQQRLVAPIMLFNQANQNQSNETVASIKPLEKTSTIDPNSQFLQQTSTVSEKTIQATRLAPLNQLVGEGQLIHAILETAINSDLPGSLRAIIDEPVYAEDDSQILIPPGSRLIGQYKSGMLQGQSRIFVVWTRLITPQGLSLNLASPGVDSLGMGGMSADTIDHHFWRQFGSAVLLSVLGASASNVGAANMPYNASQAYRIAVSNSLNQTAQQTLQQGIIPPTLWINQGSPIQVFVAHDLDFRLANQETSDKVNIF